MKLVSDKEKRTIVGTRIKSFLPLGVCFYIMGILLPLLTCIVLTGSYNYLYMELIGIFILFLMIVIYPLMVKIRILKKDIYYFDGTIFDCKKGNFYYYLVQIKDCNGSIIKHYFPVLDEINIKRKVKVCMILGKKNHFGYCLLDSKGNVLTGKKTRFDLFD